ncbi:MAG: type IV pilus biogenesis/stability protein PilW [Enterobacterales bacterium endosymbiont of Blomia tropicalis]|uniref:type IV pilus biogenesis/stability protein PilW n=1 Tax=Mixta mediterraneensis TaxID=2758443 RepID=UPI0025A92956|nr:type IV pilus biogenesis/stability protein PilW [Mixta mediterraneensis]MDL4912641.1 type IV pilus biogenesis/stability protein PilW [Mixta mediterraneensis]
MHKGLSTGLLALFVVSGCVSKATPPGAAEVRLQLGMHYLAVGDYAAAQRNFLRAQAAAPRDYRIALALARLAQRQGNMAASTEQFLHAQRLAPDNGYIANNYGAFLCALGQYDEAHQQFKRAKDAPEGDARIDALELSGYCYLQAGDDDAARSALLHALDADRSKGESVLAEAERLLETDQQANTSLLLKIYQQRLPETARSLALHIRFAAQQENVADVRFYGDQLARRFPQSIQYQRYLANEY